MTAPAPLLPTKLEVTCSLGVTRSYNHNALVKESVAKEWDSSLEEQKLFALKALKEVYDKTEAAFDKLIAQSNPPVEPVHPLDEGI